MRTVRVIALGLLGLVLGVALVLSLLVGPSVYRMFRAPIYETAAPHLPALGSPALLVFSKTNGFRDEASIKAANAMFRDIARRRGWRVYVTENGAVFNPADLAKFRVVIWSGVSGDVLTPAQREAFRRYLEQGGGFIGVHGAGGDPSYAWRWYAGDLIGARFVGHTMWPEVQRAVIHIEAPTHPAMAGLPPSWPREDEWYSFDRSVRSKPGFRVLATVQEASYTPHGITFDDLRMGPDHPVVWSHCVGRGRALYSAMGHTVAAYAEPLYTRMLTNAIAWAAGSGACADGR